MNKIGILGATGSVGKHALKYLHAVGKYELSVASRNVVKLENDNFSKEMKDIVFVPISVTNDDELRKFIRENDVILNAIPGYVRNGAEIAKICIENGRRYIDAGTGEDFATLEGNCIYGAGALPGFSAPLAFHVAENYAQISSLTHITSMSGIFSYGAAYDYLSGVVKEEFPLKAMEKRMNFELPFVGISHLSQYIDDETQYVCKKLGVEGKHFVGFGLGGMNGVINQAALTFKENREEAAQKLVEMSKLYNVKTNEHIAFIVEINGTKKDGMSATQTLVLKMASSQALTGLVAGLCTEMMVECKCNTGTFSFTNFFDTELYESYMLHFIDTIRNSDYTHMFEIFPMSIEELNAEKEGEI